VRGRKEAGRDNNGHYPAMPEGWGGGEAATAQNKEGPEGNDLRISRRRAMHEGLMEDVNTDSGCHQTLRPCKAAGLNRRMRKTARPVVWEAHGAQSPCADPIAMNHQPSIIPSLLPIPLLSCLDMT
jgi:hypothetical protein